MTNKTTPPPLGRRLKSAPIPKEPPSRSLVRVKDLRAHPRGASVGMASSVFGFGTVRAAEPMIEIRTRTDYGAIEPVYLTAKVLARAVQKLRAAGIDWARARASVEAASKETERKLRKIKRDKPKPPYTWPDSRGD